jgi:hypothetical protein
MVIYCDDNMHNFTMYVIQSKTTFEIFYLNIRGLRTKQTELFDNVCSMDFQIICLTDRRLNDMCFDNKIFPGPFTTFHCDTVSSTKPMCGGVLITVSSRVIIFKHRYYLQFCEACVWVESTTQNCLRIGNNYPPPTPARHQTGP